jgi:hypothetical protein
MNRVFLVMVVSALLVTLGFAQTPDAGSNPDAANVKGCLGGSDGNYTVVEDGTRQLFKITTSGVDLKPHLGHDVKLIGHKAGATASPGAADNSFAVTELSMISEHCAGAAAAAAAATVIPPAETVIAPDPAPGAPSTTASVPAAAPVAPSATASTPGVEAAAPAATAAPSAAVVSTPAVEPPVPAVTVAVGAPPAPPAVEAVAPAATVEPPPSTPAVEPAAPVANDTHPARLSAHARKLAAAKAAAAAESADPVTPTPEPAAAPVADAATPAGTATPVSPSETVAAPDTAAPDAAAPDADAPAPAATHRTGSLALLITFVVLVVVLGTTAPLIGRWRKRKALERDGSPNLSFTNDETTTEVTTNEAGSGRDKAGPRKVA